MIEYEGYYIKSNKNTPQHFEVVTSGRGGKIPDVLSGIFTTPAYAKQAIDKYLSLKEDKSNGKAISKS